MTEPVDPEDRTTESVPSVTNVSGGVNVTADQMNVGGDVIARDKTISATTYIEHATIVAPAPIVSAPADEVPAPGEPPFKGLQYFDEADADLFFGREALTAKLAARVPDDRFLAIVGASGSGKSSVVRAGLIPAMKRDHSRWPIHLITPTAHPLKELAASLTRNVESVTATSTMIDDLQRDARSLDLAVAKLLKQDSRADRLLLIVDQFEELFTACKDEVERRAFVNNLLHAAAFDTAGPTTVVITLRADFYAHCAQFEQLREALAQHQEYIGPMSADELRRAIEEPARRTNWQFEPDLVDLILRDVGSEPGALPLLSHALLETWQRRRGRTLTLQGYTEAGGVRGAIARTADAVLAALKPDQQIIARNIFLRLTELGEGTQDTRRRAALSELIVRSEDAATIEVVLKTLTDARLITTSDDMAEVAHEALIREWPRLRAWLDEDREGLRIHHQLTEDVQDWVSLQRDPGALYRGPKLDRVTEWQKRDMTLLSTMEQEFTAASLALRQHDLRAEKSRQRTLRLVVGLVTLAAILLFLMIQPSIDHELRRLRALADDELVLVPELSKRVNPNAVTNGNYRLCVDALACIAPAPQLSTFFRDQADRDRLPVVGIDVVQAARYCRWLGRHLLQVGDWEKLKEAGAGKVTMPSRNFGEWTATTSSQTEWDEQENDLPSALLVVWGSSLSRGFETYPLPPDFRRNDIGFRCVEK